MNHYFILFLFVLFRLLVPPMLPQPNSPHTHMSLITMDEENCNPERWRCTMELIAADTNTIVTLKAFLQPVCLFVPFLSISFAVFFFFVFFRCFFVLKKKACLLLPQWHLYFMTFSKKQEEILSAQEIRQRKQICSS